LPADNFLHLAAFAAGGPSDALARILDRMAMEAMADLALRAVC
jgi:hypothetical protein